MHLQINMYACISFKKFPYVPTLSGGFDLTVPLSQI